MTGSHIDFAVRYEILRGGGTYTEINACDTPEVQYISTSELKMSVKGTFYVPQSDINYLTDRLRVIVNINGVDYPCGTYIVTGETHDKTSGSKTATLEAYSPLYLAKRKKIEERLHIAAGTNYITQVNALLISAGITNLVSDVTALTISTDREDWEIGTDVLTIINTLLDEINYNSAWVDLSGGVHITKYTSPSVNNIAHIYTAGEFSIISNDYKKSNDYHDKCNVFKLICSNPDHETPLTAVSVNDSADIPFSTVNIGRVLHAETVDNIASQAELQSKADLLKFQSMQTGETIEFYTSPNPTHTAFNTVALDNDELTGVFSETEWRLPLSAESDMVHRAKRVII